MEEQNLNKNSNEASTSESTDLALFDAVLEPHRSLSQSGILTMMAAIIVISFPACIKFAFMRARPMLGFFIHDTALNCGAFKVNYCSAQENDSICLVPDRGKLTVVHVNAKDRV